MKKFARFLLFIVLFAALTAPCALADVASPGDYLKNSPWPVVIVMAAAVVVVLIVKLVVGLKKEKKNKKDK